MGHPVGIMANDHPRDGSHTWDRLDNFDHFWEGDLSRDGDHHRDGDHPRDGGCLREFYLPKGWLLNFGSVES